MLILTLPRSASSLWRNLQTQAESYGTLHTQRQPDLLILQAGDLFYVYHITPNRHQSKKSDLALVIVADSEALTPILLADDTRQAMADVPDDPDMMSVAQAHLAELRQLFASGSATPSGADKFKAKPEHPLMRRFAVGWAVALTMVLLCSMVVFALMAGNPRQIVAPSPRPITSVPVETGYVEFENNTYRVVYPAAWTHNEICEEDDGAAINDAAGERQICWFTMIGERSQVTVVLTDMAYVLGGTFNTTLGQMTRASIDSLEGMYDGLEYTHQDEIRVSGLEARRIYFENEEAQRGMQLLLIENGSTLHRLWASYPLEARLMEQIDVLMRSFELTSPSLPTSP